MRLGTLTWVPALSRPDLLADPVRTALEHWPDGAAHTHVAPIDPDLADTAAMTAAYDLDLADSGNCVLVAGKRAGLEKVAAAVVRATTRADVNTVIKRLLDVRKASFLATDRAVTDSGMEYGGITPIGLPASVRVLVDARLATQEWVIVGSGIRGSKLVLPGATLAAMPGAEVHEGMAGENAN